MELEKKVRTIITQDAEVDDQNSLRHFLYYTNEVELQGIIQTSSTFHWVGVPGAVRPPEDPPDNRPFRNRAPFDQPHRWPGTDWMWEVIDDYAKDYPNLVKHSPDYPTPDYLRSITKIGNIGYEGEMDAPTEGSELIRKHILDDDPRKLYLQAWGGPNTISRALKSIEEAYAGTPEWEALHEKISNKVVITACGEQDGTYRSYIGEVWPGIVYVHAMGSYGYHWLRMPEGESKVSLRADFMRREILNGKSTLASGYCTWLDGRHYEGEVGPAQFGSNPNIRNEWFGSRMGMPTPEPYDFLSEGDSPTFFLLFNWGFRTLEDLTWGGISGRYQIKQGECNSKGEQLNLWFSCQDHYTDIDGNVSETDGLWPYVADIQRDWAARINWCATENFEDADHVPSLTVDGGLDYSVQPGEQVSLHATAASPDAGAQVDVTWRVYEEASASWAANTTLTADGASCTVTIPQEAASGDKLHLIVKAQADGAHRLVHYQYVVITVK